MSVALSIVLVVVGTDGQGVGDCLAAIGRERGPGDEVLVAADAGLEAVLARQGLPDWARCVPAPPGASLAARRALGVGAARGEVVALVEEHTPPLPGWREAILRSHAAHTHPAVGGAVAMAGGDATAWAAWLMDYGRYHPGRSAADVDALTSACVTYKRDALLRVRSTWAVEFRETTVHAALAGEGGLRFEPGIQVVFRNTATLGALRAAWYRYGREFGEDRARLEPAMRRVLRLALAPAVAPLLVRRALALLAEAPRPHPGALPLLLPLVALGSAWAAGEAAGALRA